MKVKILLLAAIAVLAAGYLGAVHLSGGALPAPGLPLGGERARVRALALSFWEDIQFKDFKRAATYHAPDKQAQVDIPYLIERLFLQKPEALDFMEFEILFAHLDTSNLRTRVKTRVKVKLLVDGSIVDKEVMLYFKRADAEAPWYMELENSLRELEADKDKKH